MSKMSERDIARQEILAGLDNLTQSLADFGCNRLAAQAAEMFREFEDTVNNAATTQRKLYITMIRTARRARQADNMKEGK